MSKSLKRVKAALEVSGVVTELREMEMPTRTAAQAAQAVGCEIDQIVKSILFKGEQSGRLYLFLTAGGRQVDADAATRLAAEVLAPADAALIRTVTGFAIGGVAPVGHLTKGPVWLDPRLLDFPQVWAAAGTPHHVFGIAPQDLERITGAPAVDFCVSQQ